jgi:hypothetical protein
MNMISKIPTVDGPRLRYSAFFEGQVSGWGVIVDLFGRIRSHVTVSTLGIWRDGSLFLHEVFTYDSGLADHRTWILKDLTPDVFEATCVDCVGTIVGHNARDRVKLAYTFRLRYWGMTINVALDDQVFPIDDKRVFNRATMKKFGITLGHILIVAERQSL